MNTISPVKGWGLWLTTGCTLGLVALADVLFFEEPIGWTLGLFVAAAIAALLMLNGRRLNRPIAVVLTLGAVLMALALIEHPGTLPVVMAYLTLVSMAIALRGRWRNHVRLWITRTLEYTVLGWMRIFGDVKLFTRRREGRHPPGGRRRSRLRLWAVPIVLGAVFIGLLAWGNPIIATWLGDGLRHIGESIADFVKDFDVLRVLFWIAVLLWTWGLLRYRTLVRHRHPAPTRVYVQPDGSPPPAVLLTTPPPLTWGDLRDRLFDPAVVTRCLIVFNLIFAVQTVLDIAYLYSFGAAELPEGLTYREYARKGAYPLVATALLAGMFVLITFRQGADDERGKWTRRLVYLWLGQNLLLIVSAGIRLNLYVSVYSLTHLRVAAAIWMGVVLLGFVYIIVRIATRRSNAWLIAVNTITATVVLLACSFVNFDGLIANYNVRHCQQITGNPDAAWLDTGYLAQLGPEALPALHWLQQQHVVDDPPARDARRTPRDVINTLTVELNDQDDNWRAWTYRRHRLVQTLDRVSGRELAVEPPAGNAEAPVAQ